jgi:hypothetical protein
MLFTAGKYGEGGMNQKNSFGSNRVLWKFILVLVMLCFAIPLSAAENVKIKLPDGMYMYDSWISHAKGESVRFENFFVVKNNIIYNSKEAIRKFGLIKLNKLFTEKKKYKILLDGEKIGEIENLKVDDEDGHKVYEEKLFKKNIKEGPAYGSGGHSHGSTATCIAVPEGYKEKPRKVYSTISKEEVDKITKLAKEKLLPLLMNRKGFAKYKIKEMALYEENLLLLDKISYRNDELFIGRYTYRFKTSKIRAEMSGITSYTFDIVFSATKDNVHIETTNYEDGDLVASYMTIYGMLDVDGCGDDELIIEKEAPREDETTIWLEIHKQQPDGNWILLNVVKTRRIL